MFIVGSRVEFVWWSDYRAKSAFKNIYGATSWITLSPGDMGIVLGVLKDKKLEVVFNSTKIPVVVYESMIRLV